MARSLLVFEGAALPLTVIHPSGRILLANRAVRALLGYEFGELEELDVSDVVVLSAPWSERVTSGMVVTPDRLVMLRGKDGVPMAARASSALVVDDAGVVRYVVGRAVREARSG